MMKSKPCHACPWVKDDPATHSKNLRLAILAGAFIPCHVDLNECRAALAVCEKENTMAKNTKKKTPAPARKKKTLDRDDLEKDLPAESADNDAEWKALCADMGEAEDCDADLDENEDEDEDADDE